MPMPPAAPVYKLAFTFEVTMRWLAIFLLLGGVARAAGVPWIVASDDGKTRVTYRDLLSKNARQVRAETHLAAAPERVWAVIVDFAHQTEFMPYLKQIRRLGPCDGGSYFYERISPPIIDQRDYTVCVRLVADPKTEHFSRSWTLANDHGPALKEGVVRVPINEGSYELSPDKKGGTRLVYTVLTNPGGSIPAWIAKRASTSSTTDLLDAIRHRVHDPKWKR